MRLSGAQFEERGAPERVVVVPWGEVESSAGRFVLDEEAGAAAVRAFVEHATDLPIDYEHQTLGGAYASPDGTAPAAGWITRLEAVPGRGLVATVNWTDEARRMIAAREYRYLSPVAVIRKSDRKLVALHSAALTNKPAIVGMAAIVNRDPAEGDAPPAGETPLDLPERISDGPPGALAVAALRHSLQLGEGADADTVLVAAVKRIEALQSDAAQREAADLVSRAQSAGKLTEAQRGWAQRLALADRGLFDEWLRTAPVLYPPGRTAAPPPEKDGEPGGGRGAAERARLEYRANRALQDLTTEEAYVADAGRRGGD